MVSGKPPAQPRADYLVFGAPSLQEDEIREVEATLRSGWLGTGPKVEEFERAFGDHVGADCAVATSSCCSALHLTLLAAGIGPDDEVITTAHTFCATVNAILHTGALPVLADVEGDTQCIDPDRVAAAVTPRTRAILPVHFAGRPCDMDALQALATEHGLLLISDAAHCIEGTWNGRPIGALGDAACFSFYATKNITTIEGGMITTRHRAWAQTAAALRLHGLANDAWARFAGRAAEPGHVVGAGFKYNMTDVQASVGLHQLRRIERSFARRRQLWDRYLEGLADLPITLPAPEQPDARHARHLFSVSIDPERAGVGRDDVQRVLHERRIGSGVHYRAMHSHEFFRRRLGVEWGAFPVTERISQQTLSIPFSATLTEADVDDVVAALTHAVGGG